MGRLSLALAFRAREHFCLASQDGHGLPDREPGAAGADRGAAEADQHLGTSPGEGGRGWAGGVPFAYANGHLEGKRYTTSVSNGSQDETWPCWLPLETNP